VQNFTDRSHLHVPPEERQRGSKSVAFGTFWPLQAGSWMGGQLMLTVLDEAPSDEERQQSLDDCIDLLKRALRSV
jgi:hypothetical protein